MQRPVTGDRPDDDDVMQRLALRRARQGQHDPEAEQRREPYTPEACHSFLPGPEGPVGAAGLVRSLLGRHAAQALFTTRTFILIRKNDYIRRLDAFSP